MAMQIQWATKYMLLLRSGRGGDGPKEGSTCSQLHFLLFFLVITASWYKGAGGDHHFHRRFENQWG